MRSILAIDTVGPVIGVALRAGGGAAVRTARVARGAETLLVPWARELCAEAGMVLHALDGVAVSVVSGAFTGVRVGLAAAVGLAMAAGAPVVGVMSLDPRARRVAGPTLALLDARKDRAYAAWYPAGVVAEGPADIDPAVAIGWASGAWTATGEGALVWRLAIEAAGGRVADGADDPAVDVLARMGDEALERGEGTDPGAVQPLYLRPPDATPPRR